MTRLPTRLKLLGVIAVRLELLFAYDDEHVSNTVVFTRYEAASEYSELPFLECHLLQTRDMLLGPKNYSSEQKYEDEPNSFTNREIIPEKNLMNLRHCRKVIPIV
jgi:hypothetical protein